MFKSNATFLWENANNVTKLKAKKDQLIHINACYANPQIIH